MAELHAVPVAWTVHTRWRHEKKQAYNPFSTAEKSAKEKFADSIAAKAAKEAALFLLRLEACAHTT